MSIDHWLNRRLEVWRKSVSDDTSGGQVVEFVQVGEIAAKVDQPSTRASTGESVVAAQASAHHSHSVYTSASNDVRRGDELRGDGQVFRVVQTSNPSRPIYLKIAAELVEPESTL